MRGLTALSVLLISATGCNDARQPSSASVALDRQLGDTVTTWSDRSPWVHTVRNEAVLHAGPVLQLPTAVAASEKYLIVPDRQQIHLFDFAGTLVRSLGRAGDGPGEFRYVGTVNSGSGDSILAFDPALARLSVFSPEGVFARSVQVRPSPPFVNPHRDSNVLYSGRGRVVMLATTNVSPRQEVSSQVAIVFRSAGGDSVRIVRRWGYQHLFSYKVRIIAPRTLFPDRMLVDVSRDGRVVHGDGMEYCIMLEDVESRFTPPIRACRKWRRVDIGDGLAREDFAGIDVSEEDRRAYRAILRQQVLPDHMPSFDKLRFDDEGRIWVRTVPPQLAELHPFVLDVLPEKGPTHRAWDVFDRDGHLIGTEVLPSSFMPWVIRDDHAWGISELPGGELALAHATLSHRLR